MFREEFREPRAALDEWEMPVGERADACGCCREMVEGCDASARGDAWTELPETFEIEVAGLSSRDVRRAPGVDSDAIVHWLSSGKRRASGALQQMSPTTDIRHGPGHQPRAQVSISGNLRRTMDTTVPLVRLTHLLEDFKPLKLIPSSSITFMLGPMLVSVGGCITQGPPSTSTPSSNGMKPLASLSALLVSSGICLAEILSTETRRGAKVVVIHLGSRFLRGTPALGIIANGVACSIVGSWKPILEYNIPAQVENSGDDVLRNDTKIVVLVGNEGAVSPFTPAHFLLQYGRHAEMHLQHGRTAGRNDCRSG
ncbi:hypothetical protein V8D89_006681 [Ganoderma adspersum]